LGPASGMQLRSGRSTVPTRVVATLEQEKGDDACGRENADPQRQARS